jgi:hypothetical protein
MNIAVQRVHQQTLRERGGLAIRLTIFPDTTAPRRVRFFPGSDVLPFLGLLHFTRPNSSLNKITVQPPGCPRE